MKKLLLLLFFATCLTAGSAQTIRDTTKYTETAQSQLRPNERPLCETCKVGRNSWRAYINTKTKAVFYLTYTKGKGWSRMEVSPAVVMRYAE